MSHNFKKVPLNYDILNLIIINLVPNSVLHLAPSDEKDENGEYSPEWNDFKAELERVKELVERIPKSDDQRKLDNETAHLSPADRKEFLDLGNKLLVRYSTLTKLFY